MNHVCNSSSLVLFKQELSMMIEESKEVKSLGGTGFKWGLI